MNYIRYILVSLIIFYSPLQGMQFLNKTPKALAHYFRFKTALMPSARQKFSTHVIKQARPPKLRGRSNIHFGNQNASIWNIGSKFTAALLLGTVTATIKSQTTTQAEETCHLPIAFLQENIKKHPEFKKAFITFASEHICETNKDIVKTIVKVIETYPEALTILTPISCENFSKIDRSIIQSILKKSHKGLADQYIKLALETDNPHLESMLDASQKNNWSYAHEYQFLRWFNKSTPILRNRLIDFLENSTCSVEKISDKNFICLYEKEIFQSIQLHKYKKVRSLILDRCMNINILTKIHSFYPSIFNIFPEHHNEFINLLVKDPKSFRHVMKSYRVTDSFKEKLLIESFKYPIVFDEYSAIDFDDLIKIYPQHNDKILKAIFAHTNYLIDILRFSSLLLQSQLFKLWLDNPQIDLIAHLTDNDIKKLITKHPALSDHFIKIILKSHSYIIDYEIYKVKEDAIESYIRENIFEIINKDPMAIYISFRYGSDNIKKFVMDSIKNNTHSTKKLGFKKELSAYYESLYQKPWGKVARELIQDLETRNHALMEEFYELAQTNKDHFEEYMGYLQSAGQENYHNCYLGIAHEKEIMPILTTLRLDKKIHIRRSNKDAYALLDTIFIDPMSKAYSTQDEFKAVFLHEIMHILHEDLCHGLCMRLILQEKGIDSEPFITKYIRFNEEKADKTACLYDQSYALANLNNMLKIRDNPFDSTHPLCSEREAYMLDLYNKMQKTSQ